VSHGDATPNPKIREATVEDAEEIHALAGALAGTVGDSTPRFEDVRARLSELLEEPRARVLVAEGEGGAAAGAASFWIKPDLAHGDTVFEVPMLVVAEGSRRKGIGRALMEEIRRLAAGSGASVIELVATPNNVPAREFYRSLGFVETDHIALEFVGEMADPQEREKA
jgi:ribosomal protein S18 acetylase RimI-like enzyme